MTRDAWTQVLPPTDHYFNSRSFSSRLAVPAGAHKAAVMNGNWTREENKLFENALARVEGNNPDRWQRVAEAIPGKTAWEVMAHYRDLEADVTQIEAGYFPFSGTFAFSAFTLDWGSDLHKYHDHNHQNQTPYFSGGGKRLPAKSASDQERKKGVPWTQEEHRSAHSSLVLLSFLCFNFEITYKKMDI